METHEKCNVCGNDSEIKYHLKNNIYFCKNCNLEFSTSAEFNTEFISDLNEDIRVTALKTLRIINFNKIISIMKKCLPEKALGLEVGSSYGWFIQVANNNNYECYGIEPEKKIYEISKKNNMKVINGYFPKDVPAFVKDLDFVIFNDTFEHIYEIGLTLEKCFEILNEDGVLIINSPLSSGFLYNISKIAYYFKNKMFLNRLWQFNFHSPHYYYFNKTNIQTILQKNKFSMVGYHRLSSVHDETIKQRICMEKSFARFSWLLYPIVRIINPLLKYLNEDVGCFYFKKNILKIPSDINLNSNYECTQYQRSVV